MTDEEFIAEGAQHGTWIPASPSSSSGEPSRKRSKSISRVAFAGGQKFDQEAVDQYLAALKRKYPEVTVVTGNGRGAEAYVVERAAELDFTVEVTPLEAWWPSGVLQVEATLIGADAIVVVGSEKAARAARAVAKHKLVDAWRENASGARNGRPLVKIASVDTEAAPKGRPVRAAMG